MKIYTVFYYLKMNKGGISAGDGDMRTDGNGSLCVM